MATSSRRRIVRRRVVETPRDGRTLIYNRVPRILDRHSPFERVDASPQFWEKMSAIAVGTVGNLPRSEWTSRSVNGIGEN